MYLIFHLIWLTKYRKHTLKGKKVTERLRELLYLFAEDKDWIIEELNIQGDHVHMIIRIKIEKSINITDVRQFLMNKRAKVIKKEFPDLEWGISFWSYGDITKIGMNKYSSDRCPLCKTMRLLN